MLCETRVIRLWDRSWPQAQPNILKIEVTYSHFSPEKRKWRDGRTRCRGIKLPLLGRGLAVYGKVLKLHPQRIPAPSPFPADGETLRLQGIQAFQGYWQIKSQIDRNQIESCQDENDGQ